MNARLNDESFDGLFAHWQDFISTRHAGYYNDTKRIEQLTREGSIVNIPLLLEYLRPWNIEAEGNWMGREWLRGVAMDAIRYLAVRDTEVALYIRNLKENPAEQWRQFDPELTQAWQRMGDVSNLYDPFEDFMRCVDEILLCLDAERS